MNPNLKWKMAFILGVVLLCFYGLVGLPEFPTSWAKVKGNFEKRIKLGLDLQGGTHLILQVQVQEAVAQHADQARDNLAKQMREKNIPFENIERLETVEQVDGKSVRVPDDKRFVVHKVGADQAGAFEDLVRKQFTEWDLSAAAGEPDGYLLTMKNTVDAAIRTDTLRQAIETIDRRINQLGLTEPIIAEHGRGDYEILVQLPGESDPRRVKDVIRAGGQLELKLVQGERPFSSEADALASYGGILPPNTELVGSDPQAGPVSWYVLDRVPGVTGRDLRAANAAPSTKYPGHYDVNFILSTQAAPRFGAFTQANVGRLMAIVLDRKVHSAATIKSRIEDSGMIEGNFTQQQAKDLALVLRAGALPASIKYLEERTIGPSLGADSIRQGFWASIVSLVVVMIFMQFYYRMAGLNANLALVLNLVILLACLAYFGAVLTLPGIAGVILTIGMGVDSNVLIFERIREELRGGKANASAVDSGFDRAFLTIIDTHVTTVVSAIFLFMFGTGPVRGFAVTLVIGLISNLFTAVYVSRTIFNWHLAKMDRSAELSI